MPVACDPKTGLSTQSTATSSVPTSELLAVLRDLREAMREGRGGVIATLPKVQSGTLKPKELSGQIDVFDLLQGKYATVSQVNNTGDNPITARFEGVGGTFFTFTMTPREEYKPTFAFKSVEFIGTDAGPSAWRVIVQ